MKKRVIVYITIILIIAGIVSGCTERKTNPTLEDSDNDGYPNSSDRFPNNPLEWVDTDGDYVGDNSDAFPFDVNESKDSDNDGIGDNSDRYPNDPHEQYDSDNDGVGDNSDVFPYDPTETIDTDGDGIGNNADENPYEPNGGNDTDHDGVADTFDAFPDDPTQWLDTDQDGYGNNLNGKKPDRFPYDPTEWNDTDNDGYGDNSDFFNTGNGVLKLKITNFYCDNSSDGSFIPDPYFITMINCYKSGILQKTYSNRTDYFNATYLAYPVYIIEDIEDNIDMVQIQLDIRDADKLTTQNQIDINNSNFSINPKEIRYQKFRVDGRGDLVDEIDAWFNVTIEIKYCDCP